MTKIHKDRIRKWVKALRSGKYKQGRKALRTRRGNYCCLGVACDISKLSKWDTNSYGEGRYDGHVGDLPRRVKKWFGMALSNPLVTHGKKQVELASLNDRRSSSFRQVADLIESQWLTKKT